MKLKGKKQQTLWDKELSAVEQQEGKLAQAARKAAAPQWKTDLESRIPEKVYSGLESAFGKGFAVVFKQGQGIIERSFNREALKADHEILDFAIQRKGGRKELRKLHSSAKRSDFQNLAVTTVEGIGLGALGVGMPDVVLFLATLLKGIYETALHYGFPYESGREQLFILKMMETALTNGESWTEKNKQVDEWMVRSEEAVSDEEFARQIKATASAFAVDMLLLKFIQGIPVVGILGGAANPVYYSKVMKYVQLKYRKRYLLKQIKDPKEAKALSLEGTR